MKNGLLFAGTVAAGLSAVYLLDKERGPKRRKLLKKKADRALKDAAHVWNNYSHELQPYWERYSKEFARGAETVAAEGHHRVEEATQNGWSPSARLLGATASAMAFCGAGRRGIVGSMLRIVSLGLFTRALLASK